MPGGKFLTAAEAAARLGVHRSTLYAYVSRGRVRRERDPANPHASRYLAADVDRLRDGARARRHPAEAARRTLHFGLPVLSSAITRIEDGRLWYRDHDAVTLARTARFEDAVRILWRTNALPADAKTARAAPVPSVLRAALRRLDAADRLSVVVALAACGRARATPNRAEGLVNAGWRLVQMLAGAVTLDRAGNRRRIAARLAAAWGLPQADASLVDAALVLCADHELNASTFAVRVAASAGAALEDAVLAGLSTLRGARHGGHTEHVERMLDRSRSASALRADIARRVEAREHVPGFGHPLYPDGDPRGRLLVDLVLDARPSSSGASAARTLTQAGADIVGDHLTIDAALVILRRALGLPRGAAFLLFAIGRSAGWIAHAMEQYQSPEIIRPRAAYPAGE